MSRSSNALIAVLLMLAASAADGSAQFRYGSPPEDLTTYDWTAWLVGEWEGTFEYGDTSVPYRQTFEFSPDRKYIITHNQRGGGEEAYRGLGVFSYYPATNEAYGQWFGVEHDTNDGWGVREGAQMRWTIRRLGMRVTRVRIRTGENTYIVENEVLAPDGSVSRSREVMRRVGT